MLELTRHWTPRWKCSPNTTVFVAMEHSEIMESCAEGTVPSPLSAISSFLAFKVSATSVSFQQYYCPHPTPQHEYKQKNLQGLCTKDSSPKNRTSHLHIQFYAILLL